MAKSIFTGWRVVTPGSCSDCGYDDGWGFEGGGSIQCNCQMEEGEMEGFDFTDANPRDDSEYISGDTPDF